MRMAIGAVIALLGTTAAHGSVVLDDFNRPDGAGFGPDYTVRSGRPSILNNRAVTTVQSLATYDGSFATAASDDVALSGRDAGSYVALTLGYGGERNYFIKVQDDNGDGLFDRYAFYGGNNELNGVVGDLGAAFRMGSIAVSYSGTVAKLVVGTKSGSQTYTHDYGFLPGLKNIGLGLNGLGAADNLRFDAMTMVGVPEPESWALMIGGFALAGAAARRRRRMVVLA